MPFDELEGLDSQQKDAASCLTNSVVAAGAGSGKTRVLAARYAWLVLKKGFPVDSIVTLTFTQKAVTDMYGRIYAELCRAAPHSKAARTAVENFHTARISTLDSYCASIARTASRFFGLTPDFTVDNAAVRDQIRQECLSFVIKNRQKPAIRLLLGETSLEQLVDGLFVKTFVQYSTLTSPIDFDNVYRAQKATVTKAWQYHALEMAKDIQTAQAEFDSIIEASVKKTSAYKALQTFFADAVLPAVPTGNDLEPLFTPQNEVTAAAEKKAARESIACFLTAVHRFSRIALLGKISDETLSLIKSLQGQVRESYRLAVSAANYLLYADILHSLFSLLGEFQQSINRLKRLGGTLTFLDVSQLALDALIQFPDIRQNEKKSINAIMIDEFQDNNEAQRNLLFLLAEQTDSCCPCVPTADKLCTDKLFFVGDEKQSIYKFRGADVSVFRKLKDDLGARGRILELGTNYRSHPSLIEAFNEFFSGIFTRNEMQTFDAEYGMTSFSRELAPALDHTPRVHLHLYDASKPSDTDEGETDTETLNTDNSETEAGFIAAQIEELIHNKYPVFKNERGSASFRPCAYEDFTILFRSYGKQHLFEKHLRARSIPYTCENIADFFNDAPVNDLYNLLRLIVYPRDTNAYGAVLCSPFVRLSRLSMLACLANGESLFDCQNEKLLDSAEAERYAHCRELYSRLCELQNNNTIARLISFLWYDVGYRFETQWNASVQLYTQLYDYFFELARQADTEGLPLIAFIDRMENFKASGERIEDTDIPVEQSGGVRLMSIHKSKGLEFPIVFVCTVENQGRNLQNTDLCYYDSLYGFSVNLPAHPLIPSEKNKSPGNYFFNIQKKLEEQKAAAELRRLLYVAFTRAESALFITGSYKLSSKDEPSSDALPDIIACLSAKENKSRSFLDLLLPVLGRSERHYTLEKLIPSCLPSAASSADKSASASSAASVYTKTPLLSVALPQQRVFPASGLSEQSQPLGFVPPATELFDASCVDRIVRESENAFTYADFGTLAHICVESLFTGESCVSRQPPRFPARIQSILSESDYTELLSLASSLAASFASSSYGQLVRQSLWLKTEFAFKTRIRAPSLRTGYALINGKIDLLFETADTLYLIDFKTDTVEDDRHTIQLAAYARAATDIFGKAPCCLVYYLRTGVANDITEQAAAVNLEDCIQFCRSIQ